MNTPSAADRKKPHHHGNLRSALVQAGIDLLEDGGLPALTLRKCAAKAGVSHAAPAHHFNGLDGLKAAIAQEAFRRFSASMLAAAEAGDPSPRGRLKSICRGYLHFGQAHPALLQMIFGVTPEEMEAAGTASPDDFPGDHEKGTNAYQILSEACAPFVPSGTDPRIVEIQVWSLAHGFTLLALPGRFIEGGIDHTDALFDQVMALLHHVGPDAASTSP